MEKKRIESVSFTQLTRILREKIRMKDGTPYSHEMMKALVKGVFEEIMHQTFGENKRVMLRGFGTFRVVTRKARKIKSALSSDPGREIDVPERRVMILRTAKELRRP